MEGIDWKWKYHLGLSLCLMHNFQVVTSRWSIGIPTYLASTLEIAVLEVEQFWFKSQVWRHV